MSVDDKNVAMCCIAFDSQDETAPATLLCILVGWQAINTSVYDKSPIITGDWVTMGHVATSHLNTLISDMRFTIQ